MEVEFVSEDKFVEIARSRVASGEKKELKAIDGHNRWVFTREDGSQYILRPQTDE